MPIQKATSRTIPVSAPEILLIASETTCGVASWSSKFNPNFEFGVHAAWDAKAFRIPEITKLPIKIALLMRSISQLSFLWSSVMLAEGVAEVLVTSVRPSNMMTGRGEAFRTDETHFAGAGNAA